MSLVLFKELDGPWDEVREGLRQDLDRIQTAFNYQMGQLLDTSGQLRTTVIQQTIVGAALVYPLGGADQARVPIPASPAWRDVLNYNPYVAGSSFQARIRVWLWTLAGTESLKAGLYNSTNGVRVESSPAMSSTRVLGETTFLASIVAGNTYRLQAYSATGGIGVYAIGQLEAVG